MAVDGDRQCLFPARCVPRGSRRVFLFVFVSKVSSGESEGRGASPPLCPRHAQIADQIDIFLKIGSGISLMIVMTGHQIHLV